MKRPGKTSVLTPVAKVEEKKARNPDFDLRRGGIPRELVPTGRIRFSLGTRKPSELKDRRRRLQDLVEHHAWDILLAIQSEELTVAEVCRRVKKDGVEGAVEEIRSELVKQNQSPVPTFREEVADYVAWYATRYSPEGAKDVRSRLQRLGRQLSHGSLQGSDPVELNQLPITQVSTLDLENGFGSMTSSANTWSGLRTAASGLFTWSVDREAKRAKAEGRPASWAENPVQEVRNLKQTVRDEVVEPWEVARLREAAQLYQLAYLDIFLLVGLRLGELIHLRAGVDLVIEQDWLVSIQARGEDARCGCAQCREGGWSPKSARSRRSFQIPEEPATLRNRLKSYLNAYPVEPGEFVFRNPRTNGVWTARAFQEDFKALCARAKVTYGRMVGGKTIHTLRHTCGTNLVKAGVNLKIIADLLGDTPEVAARTYLHPDRRDVTAGIEAGLRHQALQLAALDRAARTEPADGAVDGCPQ